jgi:MoaA/NifB/PqqE/SkfB family radical SAM enzyme
LSEYLVVDRIEFVVTYNCNSRCIHCQIGEEERKMQPAHVDKDKSVQIVKKVGRKYSPKSIMTFGGESLLFPEIACAIHRQAKKEGIPIRDVITNGFWSTKPEKIEETAQNLAKAGVNVVSLSVDYFHQRFVPLKIVKKAAASAVEAGIERVCWNPCWIVSKNHDNIYNRKTKAILRELRSLNIEESDGNNVQPKGRARTSLTEYLPSRTSMPEGKCGDMPYTELLDSVKTISIEPDGRVAVCENFYIGNAYTTDIITILENYNPHKIPEAKAILEKGMPGLIKWAKQKNVEPNPEGYYNICHMCTDLRQRASTTTLRRHQLSVSRNQNSNQP